MPLELINDVILNLNGEICNQRFNVKCGNNLSNIFMVTIQNENKNIHLDGIKAKYCIVRADGTQNLSDAIIENDKIKIVLTESDLSTAGLLSCEIILSQNEVVVFTSIFYVNVLVNSLDTEKIKVSDEYSSIINIINKADNLINDMSSLEQKVSENEELRQENELSRISTFKQIENKSKEIIADNELQTQNAKEQAEYAKKQGDYAKEQADNLVQIQEDFNDLQLDINDIKSYIGYSENDIYGVEVDFKNNKFTRLAGAKYLKNGTDFDNINAYKRKRCNVTDDGVIIAYYGDKSYSETGKLTQEVTIGDNKTYPIGTIVQVMIEQPKFYYKVVPLELEPFENGKGYHLRKVRYYISDKQYDGFKIHPAFVLNGVEKDKIYLSAYEGSVYDISDNLYLESDEQISDFNSDKLCSVANVKPCSGRAQRLTIDNAIKLANNRGTGWSISTIQSISCTQLLFLIEYAYFNMQDKIGVGVVNKLGEGNDSEKTGMTSSLGNATGTDQNNAISYRGEENFYGNIWCYVDKIKIYNDDIGNISIFSDDSYVQTNINIAGKNGYISAFGYDKNFDWLFIPSETVGNDKLPVGDYFYQNIISKGSTIAMHGGGWSDNTFAGGYYMHYYYTGVNYLRIIGCRLTYTP